MYLTSELSRQRKDLCVITAIIMYNTANVENAKPRLGDDKGRKCRKLGTRLVTGMRLVLQEWMSRTTTLIVQLRYLLLSQEEDVQ